MVQSLKEILLKEKSREKDSLYFKMVLPMKEIFKIMIYKDLEHINGAMAEFIKDNGKKIKCMETDY